MTTDHDRPVIAVVGATGSQGGGLARAIIDDPQGRFTVRAITRDPSGPRAQALAAAGAQVVRADLDDPLAMLDAFAGAHGVFGITNFWEHLDPAREQEQAANLAMAAAKADVRHVVWSTLEDVRRWVPLHDARIPTLMGRYKVPHMDAKAEADAYFADLPTTYLLTSFYWENLLQFGLAVTPDGDLVLAMPLADAPLPGMAARDIGACALGLFARGEETVGLRVGVAGEHLTGAAMAEAIGAALGRPVGYVAVPADEFAAADLPGARELANMFSWKVEFSGEYAASRSVDVARALHPGLQDFSGWLTEHAAQIPIR